MNAFNFNITELKKIGNSWKIMLSEHDDYLNLRAEDAKMLISKHNLQEVKHDKETSYYYNQSRIIQELKFMAGTVLPSCDDRQFTKKIIVNLSIALSKF